MFYDCAVKIISLDSKEYALERKRYNTGNLCFMIMLSKLFHKTLSNMH